jgi:hypothetical protein
MSTLVIPGDGALSPKQTRRLARQFAAELAASGKTGQLLISEANFARPYVYSGEWVADCPRKDCGNTILMTLKDDRDRGVPWTRYERLNAFHCGYCGYVTNSVHWPVDAELILDILDCRPIGHTRNWYPEGHKTAVAAGTPDGQTLADLVKENSAHDVPTRVEVLATIALAARGEQPSLGLPR